MSKGSLEKVPQIIYENHNLLAVNKPPGIVVFHEEGYKGEEKSLASLLSIKHPSLRNVGGIRNGAVHRLDKETSGVILFAKNEKTLSFLQKALLEKKVKKRYITLVFKRVKKDEGEVKTFIERSPKDRRRQRAVKKGKREAVTFFKTIKKFKEHSLLEVFPETGRKHQIRCHLFSIGHPIAGDKLYRFKDQKDPPDLQRHFLHAEKIEIETPEGRMEFKAKLAEDLEKVLKNLLTQTKRS